MPKRRTTGPPPKNEKEDAELDRLREQVRQLTIDNQALRALIAQKEYPRLPAQAVNDVNNAVAANPRERSRRESASAVPPEKSCSCRGNCGTRQCGCRKRGSRCTEFCRCRIESCANSEPMRDNDKENATPQLATAVPKLEPPDTPERDFNPMVPRRQLARTPVGERGN